MKDAIQHIVAVLHKRGYRVTGARTHIIGALLHQHHPQTIQELTAKVSADEASVYRTILLLRNEGFVEEIPVVGGKSKFSIAHDHHHHVICSECGIVAHVPCEKIHTPKKLPKTFSAIQRHEVTFYGRCKKCA